MCVWACSNTLCGSVGVALHLVWHWAAKIRADPIHASLLLCSPAHTRTPTHKAIHSHTHLAWYPTCHCNVILQSAHKHTLVITAEVHYIHTSLWSYCTLAHELWWNTYKGQAGSPSAKPQAPRSISTSQALRLKVNSLVISRLKHTTRAWRYVIRLKQSRSQKHKAQRSSE